MSGFAIKLVGELSLPLFVLVAGIIMIAKKDAAGAFISGARSGFSSCVRLLPTLILLIVAVHMFSASGALDIVCSFLEPAVKVLHIPKEVLPVVIMRPISGSGTTAMMQKLLSDVGPDSYAGRCASIIMGASDTIIYTLAVYFGSVGVKRTRHALFVSFAALVFCVAVSVILTDIFFKI